MSGAIVPRATYRVQLEQGFTFADAAALVPYLAKLGISHLYSSPLLAARPSSTHGYDVVDPGRLNPDLGTEEDFTALVATLRAHGMGLIVDIVPNHMGAGQDNPWWRDLMEWGDLSPYARFFDIDRRATESDGESKLLLAVLGNTFGASLTAGELRFEFVTAAGTLDILYFDNRFPISPFLYGEILRPALPTVSEVAPEIGELLAMLDETAPRDRLRSAAAALKQLLAQAAETERARAAIEAAIARYAGTPGDAPTWLELGRLIDRQPYRLAWWRVASEEINYRRFFDVNDLAGLRVERPEVFEASHGTLLALVRDGQIDGLRIDHVDGLADPEAYLHRLRDRAGPDTYIVVEKILAPTEALPQSWPIAGTTGYDALNELTRLFMDPVGEAPLTTLYHRIVGRETQFSEIRAESKRLVLRTLLASEVQRLVRDIRRVAARFWHTRDLTQTALREALEAILVALPVYRTYIGAAGASDADRALLAEAVQSAQASAPTVPPEAFEFLERLLSGDMAESVIVRRAQQLSGPAMAKGLEDTAFYRYFRLIALNEVGGDPDLFAAPLATFHAGAAARVARWPDSMLAASTHDTKRGEDARARLICLASVPDQWEERLARWRDLGRRHLRHWVDRAGQAGLAPSASHEYYIYQSLLGVWPVEADPPLDALADRLAGALVKAMREGKEQTSWIDPDEAYETATVGFMRDLLEDAGFLEDFVPFAQRIAYWGALTSLSQTLVRLTMPGVPDIYRGAEGWELSLVDPDNRRPVDYAPLKRALDVTAEGSLATLLPGWRDAAVKIGLIARTLALRAAVPRLFGAGTYDPIAAEGARAGNIVSFLREQGGDRVAVIAPRFWPRLVAAEGSAVELGGTVLTLPAGRYRNVLTGTWIASEGTPLQIAALLGGFAVAMLHGEAEGTEFSPGR